MGLLICPFPLSPGILSGMSTTSAHDLRRHLERFCGGKGSGRPGPCPKPKAPKPPPKPRAKAAPKPAAKEPTRGASGRGGGRAAKSAPVASAAPAQAPAPVTVAPTPAAPAPQSVTAPASATVAPPPEDDGFDLGASPEEVEQAKASLEKTASEAKAKAAASVKQKLVGGLKGSDLSKEDRQQHAASVVKVTGRMPAEVIGAIDKGMKQIAFHGSPSAVAGATAQDFRSAGAGAVADSYQQRMNAGGGPHGVYLTSGQVRIDGAGAHAIDQGGGQFGKGGLTSEGVLAHELTHAIDGPDSAHSNSSDWQAAHNNDIAGGQLTNYGAANHSEGFAEFGRLLYGTDIPLDHVEKSFPKASAYFKSNNLWPRASAGRATKSAEGGQLLPELFGQRLQLPGGPASHADMKLSSAQSAQSGQPAMFSELHQLRAYLEKYCGGKGSGVPGPCGKGRDNAHKTVRAHANAAQAAAKKTADKLKAALDAHANANHGTQAGAEASAKLEDAQAAHDDATQKAARLAGKARELEHQTQVQERVRAAASAKRAGSGAARPAAAPAPAAKAPATVAPSPATPKPAAVPEEHVSHVVNAVKTNDRGANLAPLEKVREHLAGAGVKVRGQQDAAINEARKRGLVTGSGAEGRQGATPAARAAAIPEEGGHSIGHLSIKQGSTAATGGGKAAAPKPAAAGDKVAEHVSHIKGLVDTSHQRDLTGTEVQGAMDKLQGHDVPHLQAVAKGIGIYEKPAKSATGLKEQIRRKISEGNAARASIQVHERGEPYNRFSEGGGAQIRGAEIFTTGIHRGKEYTTADLDRMVENFNAYCTGGKPLMHVPAVLGHEEDQSFLERSDLPAAGWVSHLYREGNSLYADISEVAPQVANLVKAHRYRTVSAEIYDEPPEGIPGQGKLLRRVAFLGADQPQIKAISDIPMPESHHEQFASWRPVLLKFRECKPAKSGAWFCFAEVQPMDPDQAKQQLIDLGADPDKVGQMEPDEVMDMLRVCNGLKEQAQPAQPMDDNPMSGDVTQPAQPMDDQPMQYGEDDDADDPGDEAGARQMAERAVKYLDKYCGGGAGQPMGVPNEKMGDMSPPPPPPMPAQPMADMMGVSNTPPTHPSNPTAGPMHPNQHPKSVTMKYAEQQIKQAEAKIARIDKMAEERLASAKKSAVKAELDALVTEGKVLPSERPDLDEILLLQDATRMQKFADTGADGKRVEVSATPFDRMLAKLKARPVLVSFAERMKGGQQTTPEEAEVAKVQRFAESDADFQHVLKIQGKTPADYVAKFKELKAKKPSLTAREYGVTG